MALSKTGQECFYILHVFIFLKWKCANKLEVFIFQPGIRPEFTSKNLAYT